MLTIACGMVPPFMTFTTHQKRGGGEATKLIVQRAKNKSTLQKALLMRNAMYLYCNNASGLESVGYEVSPQSQIVK